MVVPLRHGAGTRIKILEAAAFARPVVASRAALGGLDLVPDREVVVADGADATAAAVLGLLGDPFRADALADAARRSISRRSTISAIGPSMRRGALGESDAVGTIGFRLLWHDIDLEVADRDTLAALEAMVPTANHEFAATDHSRYGVEGRPGAYRVLEDGDLVAIVATAEDARDVLHRRLHRRVFERASLRGWIRLHGALVDVDGTRVLVTGPSGVGKSTLAFRLLLDGHAVQGDESVMLRGRESVAVARPFHLKHGAERLLPELDVLLPRLPRIDDVFVADPGRLGHPWRLTVAPVGHVVLLVPGEEVRCVAAAHTAILPALVPQLFPVTETKSALLRALATALAGVRCHRLGVGAPEMMSRAVVRDLG